MKQPAKTKEVKTVIREVPPTPKKWWESKTIWVNAALLGTVAIDYVLDANVISDPDVIIILGALVNLLLRYKTARAISR